MDITGQRRYALSMKLVAYLRVSTTGQLDGYGPDAQLENIRAWAKRRGHKIVAIKTDDITGKSDAPDRPGLVEAIKLLRKPPMADGIVAQDLWRLARTLTVQEAILDRIWREGEGGHFFQVANGGDEVLRDDPDDPMRTCIRQVIGSIGQLDRAMVVKRLRDGRKRKAAEGRHSTGMYRYGTQGVGDGRKRDAAPRDDEQEAIQRILELRAQGASYRVVCRTLDSEGHRPRRATTWSPQAVQNVEKRALSSR